jgi:hypothetical protein
MTAPHLIMIGAFFYAARACIKACISLSRHATLLTPTLTFWGAFPASTILRNVVRHKGIIGWMPFFLLPMMCSSLNRRSDVMFFPCLLAWGHLAAFCCQD